MGDKKAWQASVIVEHAPVRQDPVIRYGVARAWAMTVDDREVLINLPYGVVIW